MMPVSVSHIYMHHVNMNKIDITIYDISKPVRPMMPILTVSDTYVHLLIKKSSHLYDWRYIFAYLIIELKSITIYSSLS